MDRREVVDLLYSAHLNYTQVAVEWSFRYHIAINRLLNELFGLQYRATSDAEFDTLRSGVLRRIEPDLPDQHSGFAAWTWWRKPRHWREEYRWLDSQTKQVTLYRADEYYAYSQHFEHQRARVYLTTNAPQTAAQYGYQGTLDQTASAPVLDDRLQEVPLLDPSFLLTTHDLTLDGESAHAGRPALQATAVFRGSRRRVSDLMPYFWSHADAYKLLVDRERGVLLRYTAIVANMIAAQAWVEHIAFDEPILDAVFEPRF